MPRYRDGRGAWIRDGSSTVDRSTRPRGGHQRKRRGGKDGLDDGPRTRGAEERRAVSAIAVPASIPQFHPLGQCTKVCAACFMGAQNGDTAAHYAARYTHVGLANLLGKMFPPLGHPRPAIDMPNRVWDVSSELTSAAKRDSVLDRCLTRQSIDRRHFLQCTRDLQTRGKWRDSWLYIETDTCLPCREDTTRCSFEQRRSRIARGSDQGAGAAICTQGARDDFRTRPRRRRYGRTGMQRRHVFV